MILTEAEAKKKWCPMIRFEIGPQNAAWQGRAYTNRGDVYDPSACTCIASDCMMWAWEYENTGQGGYCGMVRVRQ